MIETWKNIECFNDYQVSSLGRVKSLNRYELIANQWGGLTNRLKKSRIKSQQVCKGNNYYSVVLTNEIGEKRMYVHRLVATAFIPNPDNKSDVNHIDGDKLNNEVSNLEWASRKENMAHAFETGLTTNHGGTHYAAIKVIDTTTGKIYDTIKQAAEGTGISNSYLKNMLCGRQKNKTSLKYAYDEPSV